MVALWWNRTGKPLGDVRLKNELQVHRLAEWRKCVSTGCASHTSQRDREGVQGTQHTQRCVWLSRGPSGRPAPAARWPPSKRAVLTFSLETTFVINTYITSGCWVLGVGLACFQISQVIRLNRFCYADVNSYLAFSRGDPVGPRGVRTKIVNTMG